MWPQPRFGIILAPKLSRRASSTASKIWLTRQAKDPFVKQRAEDAYRSRSAFKLVELDDKYKFLRSTRTVVDLGAAPGGWSEATIRRMHKKMPPESVDLPNVVAVDLLPIVPVPGVHIIQGDFLSPRTHERVTSILSGRSADVVLSDMCQNITGNRDRDAENSLQLCHAALSFARLHLICVPESDKNHRRGVLIMKYFVHPDMDKFRKRLSSFFHRVDVFKPKSSRSDSSENYFVCLGWRGAYSSR